MVLAYKRSEKAFKGKTSPLNPLSMFGEGTLPARDEPFCTPSLFTERGMGGEVIRERPLN
jgi:hypothetical protein